MPHPRISITNDQVFKRVFGSDPELCRRLVELALDEPIDHIVYVQTQKESRNLERPGGTYFDVVATTASGELVDVEMQADSTKGLPQRARLYSGRLTMEAWSRHVETKHDYEFQDMPRVAVVFVCGFDPFEKHIMRYTWHMRCDQADLAGDGAMVVYLNAEGSRGDVAPDLAAFLSYVARGEATSGESGFVDEVARSVARLSGDPEFLEGLMNMDEKLWRSEQKGLEQGRAEGSSTCQRQIAELAKRMAADGRKDELFDALADGQKLDAELTRYGIHFE